MKEAILAAMSDGKAYTCLEISQASGERPRDVQDALRSLDDEGCVFLRDGFCFHRRDLGMRDTLKAYLRIIPSASAVMMAQELGLPHREVQEMLHQMDDDGDVILRSGWYRLSEATKIRLGDSPEAR